MWLTWVKQLVHLWFAESMMLHNFFVWNYIYKANWCTVPIIRVSNVYITTPLSLNSIQLSTMGRSLDIRSKLSYEWCTSCYQAIRRSNMSVHKKKGCTCTFLKDVLGFCLVDGNTEWNPTSTWLAQHRQCVERMTSDNINLISRPQHKNTIHTMLFSWASDGEMGSTTNMRPCVPSKYLIL